MKSENAFNASLGARIRLLRLGKALSQKELGDQLGISFQQVQKYERGSNRISAARLIMVCQALEISVAELLEGLAPEAPQVAVATCLWNDSPETLKAVVSFNRIADARTRRLLLELMGVLSPKPLSP